MSGRKGSSLKAHDFYHHLITHHNLILMGEAQSQGGKKVWDRLRTKKDVTIHTWDDKRESTKNQPELITSKKQQNKMYDSHDIDDFNGKSRKDRQKIIDMV